MMLLLAGGDLALPDRLLSGASLLVDGDRIAAIEPRIVDAPKGARRIDVRGCLVVPGFIDVHVHGVEGHDVLDGPGALARVAARLPRYGVTAFCPTSVACPPAALEQLLQQVGGEAPPGAAARVLPAHLESNFINPDYRGAQPQACLRVPGRTRRNGTRDGAATSDDYDAADILDVIARYRAAVGIVTLAPELDGGLELVRDLTAAGHIVSLGHTGATYEEAGLAIEAGARHATHLFNRMSPLTHRAPGVPGAVLESSAVAAELICDGYHVHPAVMHLALRAKGADGIMAITDGTAGSGLPVGSRTHLGGRRILVTRRAAELEDGTLAGSVLTMDAAFRLLVKQLGLPPVEASRLCATTPARQLGLADTGRLEVGCRADLVVLDATMRVRQTYLAGTPWRNPAGRDNV